MIAGKGAAGAEAAGKGTGTARREVGVRVAAFEELDTPTLYALLRLRGDVFVVEQTCAYPDLDGRDLEAGTRHLWSTDEDGTVTGYLRILAEPDGTVRIGRVCTAVKARGDGLAVRLMDRALAEAGEHTVVLDAQTYLVGFYERYGFTATGPEFLDDGIPHVPMRR